MEVLRAGDRVVVALLVRVSRNFQERDGIQADLTRPVHFLSVYYKSAERGRVLLH